MKFFSSSRTVVGGREKVETKRETSFPDGAASNDSALLRGMSWKKELLHHFVTLSGTHTQKPVTISLGLWTENNSQWVVLIMLENRWKKLYFCCEIAHKHLKRYIWHSVICHFGHGMLWREPPVFGAIL